MIDMRGYTVRYDGKRYPAIAIEHYQIDAHAMCETRISPHTMRVAVLNEAGCLGFLEDLAFRFRFTPFEQDGGGKT